MLWLRASGFSFAGGSPPELANPALKATFGARGLASITLLSAAALVQVKDDNFAIGLNGTIIHSSSLADPTVTGLRFLYNADAGISIGVEYSLAPAASFVTKALTVTSMATGVVHNITNVTLFAGTALVLDGTAPTDSAVASSHFGLKDYALFPRWPAHGVGALLTARNPFLTAAAAGTPIIIGAPSRRAPQTRDERLSRTSRAAPADPTHVVMAPPRHSRRHGEPELRPRGQAGGRRRVRGRRGAPGAARAERPHPAPARARARRGGARGDGRVCAGRDQRTPIWRSNL